MKYVLKNVESLNSWDDLAHPWQWCVEEAWQAYCMGSLPIGAVVTDEMGQLLARGRNRIYEYGAAGAKKQILYGHRLAHAEMNALISVEWDKVNSRVCSLYTTTEPCPLCVGAVRLARIGTIHYASRDSGAGSIDLFTANSFMKRPGTRIHGPGSETLENILIALLVEFTLHEEGNHRSLLYETIATMHPVGAALGKQLFITEQLHKWKQQSRSASFIFNQLLLLMQKICEEQTEYDDNPIQQARF